VVVVYLLTLSHGGPVAHVRDLAPRVAARGHDVRVETVAIRSKWDMRGALSLWRVVAGADVVHTQDRRAGWFGRVFGRLRGTKVVHTYHGLPEDIAPRVGTSIEPPLPWRRRVWIFGVYLPIERLLARLGPVLVPSQAMADFLAGPARLPKARLLVRPSGIDVRRHEPGPRHQPLRLAVAANLEHWKGVDLLLEACALVAVPVHLDVYGDGAEADALAASATRLGVDATFHGRVDGVRDLLLDADVYVHPSRADNLPIAVLEAMAAALPVVATRVGGVPELVDDGVTGIVVPADDAPALAHAIERLANDDGQRVAMGRAGAARVAEDFDPDDTAAAVVQVYEELCASSR
jgi:glycosyltransferase involved in cell wall biosynthesis